MAYEAPRIASHTGFPPGEMTPATSFQAFWQASSLLGGTLARPPSIHPSKAQPFIFQNKVTWWTKGFGSDETSAYRHRSKSMDVQWDGKEG
ncbi:hypothetical protein CKAN_02493900 [Cinnamomum micranthum f. kanehirae]|uniref:Uncharacterized protein n=1 Tax=Cinnamomum micranthum f. kanehirae TaxID=337451 RepID=A0A3S3NNG9_9MAGN|nr:hypothetical protein CKAN_02493900 [Cinnamomum micranthum f. kanehirae]